MVCHPLCADSPSVESSVPPGAAEEMAHKDKGAISALTMHKFVLLKFELEIELTYFLRGPCALGTFNRWDCVVTF